MSETSQREALPAVLRRLMLGQSLSITGDTFTQVAMAVFVLKISHHSPVALGLVLSMMYAPRLVMGWAAMGWIDRWNKRRILLVSDGARAILVLSIALIHTFFWTLAAVFLIYVFQMVYHPTVRSIQPVLAGSTEANRVSVARQEQWSQAGHIIAYIAAGFLFLQFGASLGFVIDAISYVAAGLSIISLPASLSVWQTTETKDASYSAQIREGLHYTRSHRLIIILIIISFVAMVGSAGSGTLLAPAMARMWHQPTAHYAWALLAISLGIMVGAYLLEVKGSQLGLRGLLVAGFAVTGLATLVLIALPPHLWMVMLILAIAGVGNAAFSTSIMVWLQQSLPFDIRGRVMTLRSMLMGLGGMVGSYGVGAIINHSIRLGFWAVGAVMLCCGAILLVPWFFAAKSDAPVAASL